VDKNTNNRDEPMTDLTNLTRVELILLEASLDAHLTELEKITETIWHPIAGVSRERRPMWAHCVIAMITAKIRDIKTAYNAMPIHSRWGNLPQEIGAEHYCDKCTKVIKAYDPNDHTLEDWHCSC